ncbi:hypothetical protein [Streptomyces sp. SID3212]|uniref:hypothetical protein n=1 Tax=Streptomyces sp. SID3212 TaxID=2690259 RepID=UPI00136FF1E6|nr:hypothetical protein [Streptomyces sp. SID3212]MYV56471.1 hypothetical protein [Streptomyces sp. SID3212]
MPINTLASAQPVTARDAAEQLLADGHHVHVVSGHQTTCLGTGAAPATRVLPPRFGRRIPKKSRVQAGAFGIREVRLACFCATAAQAVVESFARPEDTTHTVRADDHEVVIGYADLRWPIDVSEWAHTSGHAHTDAAAAVITAVQA